MPIDHVAGGQAATDIKLNEMIDAINALTNVLANQGAVGFTWVKFRPDTGVIEGQGPGIASVVNTGGQDIKITFDDGFFASADDYAAVASCSILAGNDSGFAVINSQQAEYVQFVFRTDDGTGGTPAVCNVLISWNLSL
jgi:hypothetical protein